MLVRIESLNKTYRANGRSVAALREVSLALDAGQFVALQGPSGSGKSTLLLAVGGLLRPDTGHVRIGDEDLYALASDARSRFRATNIGFVFQQFHLVPYLNVLENVLAASTGRTADTAGKPRQRALQLIDQFGLSHRRTHRPGELSTGERQRTALARALLNGPRLLLADEPTGNLDDENAQTVLQGLDQFARDGGAVLLATHDRLAAEFAEVGVKIRDGKIETAPGDR